MRVTFERYVLDRVGHLPSKDVVYDWDNEIVTFLLYSPDQRLVGYQKHSWNLPKQKSNEGRYFSHVTKGKIPIFGLEYVREGEPLLVVEGVFDALTLRRLGYSAISVLTCAPSRAAQKWLKAQPNTVAICDGDVAGSALAKLTKRAVHLPEGEDCNSMELTVLKELLEREL